MINNHNPILLRGKSSSGHYEFLKLFKVEHRLVEFSGEFDPYLDDQDCPVP